jgi:hypothetical protein
MARTVQITFDCADADVLAPFWAAALGYVLQPPPEGFDSWPAFLEANGIPVPEPGSINAIVDPEKAGPRVLFLRVPEGKTAKNRVHLDVVVSRRGDDEQANRSAIAQAVSELIDLGATRLHDMDENGEFWTVMLDPEGNEFCVI